MDCCNKNGTVRELKDTLCPSCNKKGKIVERVTLDALLNSDQKKNIIQDQYLFCQTTNCEVVYYSQKAEHKFLQSHLTVPVTAKDFALNVPICYCFNVTRQNVLDEIIETGKTSTFEQISQKVKAGLCNCETKNPQGTCCLGNVSKWIKEANAIAATPRKGVKNPSDD